MKPYRFLMFLLLALPFQLHASETDSSAQACFFRAKVCIENMLSGKIQMNYEDAIYQIENAWYQGRLDYESYKEALDIHTKNIRALLEGEMDSSLVKVSADLLHTRSQKRICYQKAIANYTIYRYITNAAVWMQNGNLVGHKPYEYSSNDPMGTTNWATTQITHLLNEGNGNCFALASLFKILSDRLSTEAVLCTAPGHIYIRHANESGQMYNIELANKIFPGTGTISTITYTSKDAIKNNISLRELDIHQAIALSLVYLGKGYQYKFGTKRDEFMLQCAETALKYDDHNLNAMLLKAEVLESRLVNQGKSIQKLRLTQEFTQYEKWISYIFSLGYREMPYEMKNTLIAAAMKETAPTFPIKGHSRIDTGLTSQRYASLSGGLFDEEHKVKRLERYSNSIYDTKSGKILAFVAGDILYNQYNFDPVVFAWNIDPLAHKFPSESPYSSFGDNPIYSIDVGGAYKYPAAKAAGYTKDYPMLTKYLAENVSRDIMKSNTLMGAFYKHSGGNLTSSELSKATRWNSGPDVVIRDHPGGAFKEGEGANGYYNSTTNTIEINTRLATQMEQAFKTGTPDDKQAALMGVFITLTHETTHFGDYLDGTQTSGEVGVDFTSEVFFDRKIKLDDGSEGIISDPTEDHTKLKDARGIIERKKAEGKQDVIPTTPKENPLPKK